MLLLIFNKRIIHRFRLLFRINQKLIDKNNRLCIQDLLLKDSLIIIKTQGFKKINIKVKKQTKQIRIMQKS